MATFSELHGACSSAVEEQIPLTESEHPSTWCGVSQQLSLNQTHGWNNLLYWSILRLTLVFYPQNLDTFVIPGLPIHTWITRETAQQCLGNVLLSIIFLFSLVIPHQFWLPPLSSSFHWMGLSLHIFSKFHCLCFFLFRTYFLVSKIGLYPITLLFLFQFLHCFFFLS